MLSDGRSLEECMPFIFRSLRICIAGCNENGSFFDGEHILIQDSEHCSVP